MTALSLHDLVSAALDPDLCDWMYLDDCREEIGLMRIQVMLGVQQVRLLKAIEALDTKGNAK